MISPNRREAASSADGAGAGRSALIVDPFGRTRDYDEALFASLRDAGHVVRLLTTEFNDKRHVTPLGEGFFLRVVSRMHRRVPRMPMGVVKALGAVEYLFDLIRLAREAKAHGAVVHWQWLPFGPLAIPIIRLLGVGPNLLTAHNIVPHDTSGRSRRTATERMKYRWADRVIVHSPELKTELVEFCPGVVDRIEVIPAGLQHEEIEPADPGVVRASLGLAERDLLIGFVGLVRPYKGLADLLRAWRRLQEGDAALDRHCRLVVAGDWAHSGEEDRMELERTLAIDPTITVLDRYLPEREYVDLLNALDLAVLPYRRASQSGVALGALRYSVPLVATGTGGLPDLMAGELAEWVVPPGDIAALAERIRTFGEMGDDDRAALRAAVGRNAVRFSWEAIAKRYRDVYQEVTRATGSPPGRNATSGR